MGCCRRRTLLYDRILIIYNYRMLKNERVQSNVCYFKTNMASLIEDDEATR